MNTTKLRGILYFIVFVIASTIAIQVYWNYKNYQINKQQLINDVQVSLDNSVALYYENLTKQNTLGLVFNDKEEDSFFETDGKFSSIIKNINIDKDGVMQLDSINKDHVKNISVFRGEKADSLKEKTIKQENHFNLSDAQGKEKFRRFKDSLQKIKKDSTPKILNRLNDLEFLTSQVIISVSSDSVNLQTIDSLLHLELQRKALNVDFGLTLDLPDNESQSFNFLEEKNSISTVSKSSFLPENSILKIHFKNETKIILKRILSGILISTLLVIAVIACLFYLLKIINKQKELAEVKNDLISNITHEFKTPIATIGVALESIKDFNVIDDKEKTKNYINLSSTQLSKLNVMVEKLLETATLDSENLNLNKAPVNIVALTQTIVEKHKMQDKSKTLVFNASAEELITNIDVFHFENAINNIVDNAIKYGGDTIEIFVNRDIKNTILEIKDNGNTLTKQQASQIFDKFYRVPKGNTHDVKGFGIGLYYTKKIIEKHNATVNVIINNSTTFKIIIPNEQ